MTAVWGKLIRTGGKEENFAIPKMIPLFDGETFVGRVSQPLSDQGFTHESQFVVPCLFVSSTHFGITIDIASGSKRSTIRDYSKNGTYVNGELVGTSTAKELHGGDEISFVYKGEVKVAYRFILQEYTPQPTPIKTGDSRISQSSSAEPSSDIFTEQIASLQQEMLGLEKRIQSQTEQIDSLTMELEKATRKIRSDERSLATLQTEIDELKERNSALEANASAIMARNSVLDEKLLDEQEQGRALRAKLQQLSDELKEKTASFEAKLNIINDSNKALASERSLRSKAETMLEAEQERNRTLVMANQALQEIVNDTEQQIVAAQRKIRSLTSQRSRAEVQAESHRERLDGHFTALRAVFHGISSLLNEESEVMGGLSTLETALANEGSPSKDHVSMSAERCSGSSPSTATPHGLLPDHFACTQVAHDLDESSGVMQTSPVAPRSVSILERYDEFISQESRIRNDSNITSSGFMATQQSEEAMSAEVAVGMGSASGAPLTSPLKSPQSPWNAQLTSPAASSVGQVSSVKRVLEREMEEGDTMSNRSQSLSQSSPLKRPRRDGPSQDDSTCGLSITAADTALKALEEAVQREEGVISGGEATVDTNAAAEFYPADGLSSARSSQND